ncbi:MAG: hypothetical protein AB1304_05380 [Bacteroidota bacterium]
MRKRIVYILLIFCFIKIKSQDSIFMQHHNIFNHIFSIDIGRSAFKNLIPAIEYSYFNNSTFIHQVDIKYNLAIRFFLIGLNYNIQFNTINNKNRKFLCFNVGLKQRISQHLSFMGIAGTNYFITPREGSQYFFNIMILYNPRFKHWEFGIGFQYKDTYIEETSLSSPKAIFDLHSVFLRGIFLGINYLIKD